MIPERQITAMLLERGTLTRAQLSEAYRHQMASGQSLIESLKWLQYVEDGDIFAALVACSDHPYIRLKYLVLDPGLSTLLPRDFCVQNKVIPIGREASWMSVAMADPSDLQVIDDIRLKTRLEVMPVLARESEIAEAIHKHFVEKDALHRIASEIGQKVRSEQNAEELARRIRSQSQADKGSPLIVQISGRIIESAYYRGASDIHVEPHAHETLVRYRVDGVLYDALRLPLHAAMALIARFKIMAEMDIAEHRLPQDSRIHYALHNDENLDFDLRVSVIPVQGGEKLVMRILLKSSVHIDIARLGYSTALLETYKTLIRKPYGMILHVGPTGSGKTTSLYAALNYIANPRINVQTIEDPIEYSLPFINQSQVKPEIGYTFARALRSFLRQDPDVVLVGEIRDTETALIAIEAALTGHILFSTLHTNNAVGTVLRLLELGVPSFLVSSSLLAVVAQRLVRRLCRCHEMSPASPAEMRLMQLDGEPRLLQRPRGCVQCNGVGYRGRLGVYELLRLNDRIKQCINDRVPAEMLQHEALAAGMTPLFQDGIDKALRGLTSLDEVLRVVRDE